MQILVPISAGELVDKITILRLKRANLQGAAQANVVRELEALEAVAAGALPQSLQMQTLIEALSGLNRRLWDIEDRIRALEQAGRFDDAFVETARQVYLTNDERHRLKRRINELVGSDIVEEKSHA